MSYQVLARKWRPATFEQMVGQSHALHALTNALTEQRLHHAYLFSGTRGVGKTSLARLFAKGLNCETGVTATPCGQCSTCEEIAQGRFVDLIEVDAASRTKVDDTRELLDNVQYRPSRGRYKVYLIDEVHMLSRSSFNALLKTLEEPPEHVKFLLATTDPQRLPVTVLSRCLQFNLKSLTQEQITQQLSHILTHEQVPVEPQALTLLANAANGSMRDALSLTDQAIAFGSGKIELAQVQTMLGSIDNSQVIMLFDALLQGEIESLMQVTEQMLSYGADPQEVLRSLLVLLHQITLTQFAPAAAQISDHSQQVLAYAEQLAPEQVQLYYQLLLTGRKELPHAPEPKSGLEMALLRAVTFVVDKPIKTWSSSAKHSLPFEAKPEKSSILDPQVIPVATEVNSSIESDAPQSSVDQKRVAKSTADESSLAKDAVVKNDVAKDDSLVRDEPSVISPSTPLQDEYPQHYFDEGESFNENQNFEQLNCEQEIILSMAASQRGEDKPVQAEPASDEHVKAEQPAVESSAPQASEPLAAREDEPSVEPESESVDSQDNSSADSTTSAPAVNETDNILDAVLAARQSLLSDLGSESLKESATKKFDRDNKSKKRQPKPSLKESQKRTVEPKIEDRPSWEEPVVQVTVNEKLGNKEPVNKELSSNTYEDNSLSSSSPSDMVHPTEDDKSQMPLSNGLTVEKPLMTLGECVGAPVQGDEQDLSWYRLVLALNVGGRVRQLAVNSLCYQLTDPLKLLLKPHQKHLAADIAIEQLAQSLSEQLNQPCTVEVDIGVDESHETPLEIRKRLNQELLAHAQHQLMTDSNIVWLQEQMQAEIEPDSLSYDADLLRIKGEQIALVDSSNFK